MIGIRGSDSSWEYTSPPEARQEITEHEAQVLLKHGGEVWVDMDWYCKDRSQDRYYISTEE